MKASFLYPALLILVLTLGVFGLFAMNGLGPGAALDATASSFARIREELFISLGQTLYMVFFSTLFSLILGFLLATVMIMTGPQGLRPNAGVYSVLDITVDILRSLPFIILIIFIMPFTRLVMGVAIGTTATILPLTVAAAPFAARLIEANFLEVDKGVVEAARSFGASTSQIILRVMLPEALPAIILNIAVLAIALLGYSAMAGAVGGGGIGDLAYRLGYNRFQNDVSVWCILVLVVLVRCIQTAGNILYRRLR
ncbi:ABC transporter permease [Desulfovibrio sp. OttesenSCG-928-G15]|nr:ABC transporter permease [Desulfovibrio sp. OttesenSCG-928-G15]